MVIFSVYVVNKAGGLIYQYDNYVPRTEVEKTFSYPLDLVLKHHDEKVVVSFGQRDGIKGNVVSLEANWASTQNRATLTENVVNKIRISGGEGRHFSFENFNKMYYFMCPWNIFSMTSRYQNSSE